MEAAHADDEVRVVADRDEHSHLALERHRQHARLEQRGEEVAALLVELDGAGEVRLDDDDGIVGGRQRELEDADDRDVAGDLDDDADGQGDEPRAPAQLRHRADQERALPRREDRPQVRDDSRRVRDDVRREHDPVDRPGADAEHERLEAHRAVEAQQPAHADEHEAVAELQPAAELGRDDHEQREAGRAVGVLGRDQPDRLQAQEVGDGELERARVLAAVDVDEQVAAALDHARVDREPDAVGWLEAEREVGGAEVPVAVGREAELDAQPDVLDHGLQRAELALDRRAGFERDDAWLGADRQRGRDDLDRPELDVRRQADLQAAAAAEVDPLLAREPDEQRDVDDQAVAGKQRGQEAVGVVARRLDHDPPALQVGLDERVEAAARRAHAPHQRHRAELDAAGVARSGQDDRVALAAVDRDAEAELATDGRRAGQEIEQHVELIRPDEDPDAAGGVERALEHDRDVLGDVDRLLELAARVGQQGESGRLARARVRERVDADARLDLVVAEARAQQRGAHVAAVGVSDRRPLHEDRLDGIGHAVEDRLDPERLGRVGDVIDEGLLVEVGLAELVGVAEDRRRVVQQLGDVLPGDHAPHKGAAQAGGGDLDEPYDAGELQQLANARLVVEQVLDRKEVDELARELGDELRRVDGPRQAGGAPDVRDRAERRADRLQERRRAVGVDVAGLHELDDRLRRRLQRRERGWDGRHVPAQVEHELGERALVLERPRHRGDREPQLLGKRGEGVAIGHQGAPGLT